MKKLNTANKLALKLETLKALTDSKLEAVVGGARPTTTVLPTGKC